MSRYQFIEQVATAEPEQALCRVLQVSPAGYYQWLSRANRPAPSWEPAASAAFTRYAQRYVSNIEDDDKKLKVGENFLLVSDISSEVPVVGNTSLG